MPLTKDNPCKFWNFQFKIHFFPKFSYAVNIPRRKPYLIFAQHLPTKNKQQKFLHEFQIIRKVGRFPMKVFINIQLHKGVISCIEANETKWNSPKEIFYIKS